MTSQIGRLYALAGTLLVFFVLWAAIAAHPWASTSADPRLSALARREQVLRRDASLVQQIVAQRTALQKSAAARKQAQAAAATAVAPAPRVKVVTLPPLTITRTS
jgi:hypothetical protein